MKIAVYGIGMKGKLFYAKLARNTRFEIVYFVQTKVTVNKYDGIRVIGAEDVKEDDFEWLVIATDLYYDEIIKHLIEIKGESILSKVIRHDEFDKYMWEFSRSCMPFNSCKVCDNIVFITNSEDVVIPKTMYDSGKVFSQSIIDAFFELTSKHYKHSPKNGVFLDIGANIGTTAIYVKKKLGVDLKVIGFELTKENYDLFRVNCIINHVDDIKAECMGLSDTKCVRKYNYGGRNSGGSRVKEICSTDSGSEYSSAQMITLDEYLKNNSIEAEDIEYIWLDTEGHESNIISGAMETLMKKKIPLLQEYNPIDYYKQNMMDVYFNNIKIIYSNFVCMSNCNKVYTVSELEQFTKEMLDAGLKQVDLFFF